MSNRQLSDQRSMELLRRAQKVTPGATHSAARARDARARDQKHLQCVAWARGSHVCDVDGNEYIDYLLAMGPIILGHAHPAVNEAVKKQLDRGTMHARNHESEIELCEKMVEHIPCAEMVRLLTTGSQATAAAVTIARLYTGKEKILEFLGHYHGWVGFHAPGSHSMPTHAPAWGRQLETTWTWPPRGIPLSEMSNTIAIPWNDLELAEKVLKNQGHEIAAAITEPLLFNGPVAIEPEKGYLEGLRRLTQEHGVVLIFDEVITGFRLGLSGGQGVVGVTPDLASFAKAMGNGFPISAVAGKREIMEEHGTILTGTYNSNPVSTTAAVATITELEKEENYKHLYEVSQSLMKRFRGVFEEVGIEAVVQGPGPGFAIYFTDQEKVGGRSYLSDEEKSMAYPHAQRMSVFVREMMNRGIWLGGALGGCARVYVSVAHTPEDVERSVEAAWEAARETKKVPRTF